LCTAQTADADNRHGPGFAESKTYMPPNWSASASTTNVADNWVKSFHDPGFERIVSEAVANNFDLRVSASAIRGR